MLISPGWSPGYGQVGQQKAWSMLGDSWEVHAPSPLLLISLPCHTHTHTHTPWICPKPALNFPHQEREEGSRGNGAHPCLRVQAGEQGSQNSECVSRYQGLLSYYTIRTDMTQTPFLGFCGDLSYGFIDGGPLVLVFPCSGAPNPACDFL